MLVRMPVGGVNLVQGGHPQVRNRQPQDGSRGYFLRQERVGTIGLDRGVACVAFIRGHNYEALNWTNP